MDAPLLTKVKVGEQITIPVYVSLWSEKWQKNDPAEICFYWQVIEETGAISEHLAEEKNSDSSGKRKSISCRKCQL